MCVVSNIGGYIQREWGEPWTVPYRPPKIRPYPDVKPYVPPPYNGPTKEQFEELLELIRAGKRFDEKTGQPDCEIEEKKAYLRKLAEWVGVEIPEGLL